MIIFCIVENRNSIRVIIPLSRLIMTWTKLIALPPIYDSCRSAADGMSCCRRRICTYYLLLSCILCTGRVVSMPCSITYLSNNLFQNNRVLLVGLQPVLVRLVFRAVVPFITVDTVFFLHGYTIRQEVFKVC